MITTLVLAQENVFDPKMVGSKAVIAGIFGGKTLLKDGKEDPSLGAGFGIFEALQHRTEGGVGCVARLLALLQELIHRLHFPHFLRLGYLLSSSVLLSGGGSLPLTLGNPLGLKIRGQQMSLALKRLKLG